MCTPCSVPSGSYFNVCSSRLLLNQNVTVIPNRAPVQSHTCFCLQRTLLNMVPSVFLCSTEFVSTTVLDDGCATSGCLLPLPVAPLQVLRLLTTSSRNTSTASVFFKLNAIPSKHRAISSTPAPLKHCCNFCVNLTAPALPFLYLHAYTTSVSSLEKSLAFLFVI